MLGTGPAAGSSKQALSNSPVLRMPDFHRTFVLQTNVSGFGLGAQLAQKYGDDILPVAYASRLLNKHELNKPTGVIGYGHNFWSNKISAVLGIYDSV